MFFRSSGPTTKSLERTGYSVARIRVKPAQSVGSEAKMTRCKTCRYLTISKKNEEHVNQRHFRHDRCNNKFEPKRSFFFADIISPQKLLHLVKNIRASKVIRNGRRSHQQFSYIKKFKYEVGVYPVQERRACRIKIVCDYVKCSGCGRDAPRDIKTMYPWDKKCAQYRRDRRVSAKGKRKL